MDILVRKIERRDGILVFKPNSKSGFKFTEEYAQPDLTAFQKSCIQVKAQKDRKLGSFWTPNFCYIGMLLVEHGEVSLINVLEGENIASTEVFNKHFPEKKWYWYNKADEQNLAVQTYFMGVRAVASLLAYYYELQKTSKLREADNLYRRYLKPLGIAKILSQVDSKLACSEDIVYLTKLTDKDCLIISADINYDAAVKKSVKSRQVVVKEIVAEKTSEDAKSELKNSSYEDIDNLDSNVDHQDARLEVPKISRFTSEASIATATEDKDKSKRTPYKLPKIGDL